MIKPPKAVVITDGAKRKKVYLYEHRALEKYCEHLEKENDKMAKELGQYAKVVNEYQEVNNINQEIT